MNNILDLTLKLINDYKLDVNEDEGQNFIVDEEVIKKEIESAELKNEDVVLEIGAGFGTLTREIAKISKVIAVEKDFRLFSYLIDKFETDERIMLINDDFLDIIPPKFNKLVSNPPYNIIDRILYKLNKYDFELGVMIMPKTVSDKLISENIDSKFILIEKTFFSFQKIMDVKNDAFYPMPRVTSVMVKFYRNKPSLAQYVLLKDEMTTKNAIIRSLWDNFKKTKKESRADADNIIDKYNIKFEDKAVGNLNLNEMKILINALNDYKTN